MRGILLSAAMLCLWLPCNAHAWGDEGHEIVALIATHYLEPSVQARVDALLATDVSGLTADRSIEAEATWADRYREHHRDTQDWHYIDIETGNPEPDSAHGQLVAKIGQFRAELAAPGTSPQQRLFALQFLLHLIGDLHQPLHAADHHDHGGNEIRVMAQGERLGSLHHYWDNVFVGQLGRNPEVVAQSLLAGISPAEQAAAARGSQDAWALESFALARTEVYGRLPEADSRGVRFLDERYVSNAMVTVRQQLQMAGLRLAQVLNEALR